MLNLNTFKKNLKVLCFPYLKKIIIIIKLKIKSLNTIKINKILLFMFYNKSYINKLK